MRHNTETEEKILKTALGLFVRKGYHGTSIQDIMLKVGMTKGAFYSHFESKGALFMKLIEEYRTRFFNEIVTEINMFDGNALEKIHRTFSLLAKFASENTDFCVFLTFLTTEMNADVDFEPALRSVYIDYQKFISSLIKQGIRQGVFKKELNPDLAALSFIALHDGTLHQWVLNRQYIDSEEFVHTFRNIFVGGLLKLPTAKPEA
jgi:TetR/AcrR family transcriptional regulator, cholesterol catabolism regulator